MGDQAVLELQEENKIGCGCKDAVTELGSKDGETRIIRFIGVTDAVSNKHHFPHEVMQKMVSEAKENGRFILPYHPKSLSEIDTKALKDIEEASKALIPERKDPIPIRDYHRSDSQYAKIGRVLSIQNAPFYDEGKERFYHDVVAEVFDPHTIKLLDRGMATKFSIGFKHRYHMENGIKVSDYGIIDHYGVVDRPADGEAGLIEMKQKVQQAVKSEEVDYKEAYRTALELLDKANEECVAQKVAEGLSQDEASQKCEGEIMTEAEGKADNPFEESGAPDPENDDAVSDCVAGLVKEGISREAAEAACKGKDQDRESRGPTPTTPTEQPSSSPTQLEGKQLEAEFKAQRELLAEYKEAIEEQGNALAALLEEKKELEVKREVENLMLEGRVLPSKKQKVFGIAMGFDTKDQRDSYYDTLEPLIDYGEGFKQEVLEPGEAEMASAVKELWGANSLDEMLISNKGR